MPAVRSARGADGHRLGEAVHRVHRQVQRIDAVATGNRLQAVVIDARSGQAQAMPIVRHRVSAERHRLIIVVGRVHNQRVLADTVATVGGLEVQHVGLRSGEVVTAPLVRQRALADRHRVVVVIGRVHDGVHHIDVVASGSVHHRVAVLARRGDGLAAPRLRHSLAQLDGRHIDLNNGGDREVQRVDAVATGSRLQAVVIDAAFSVLMIAPDVRQVEAADAFRLIEMISLVHCQRQGIDAVATGSRLQAVVIDARSGQALATPVVRSLVGADGHRLGKAVGRVHRQGKHIDAVATVGRMQAVVIDACSGQALAVPAVRSLVRTDGRRLAKVVARVHRQDNAIDTVAIGGRLIVDLVGAGSRQVAVAPLVRQLVVADGRLLNNQIGRMNRHFHLIDVVTTLGIRHGVAVQTTFRDGATTPRIGFALADLHRFRSVNHRRDHIQRQGIDAVATGSRLQAVIVGAGSRQALAAPGVRHIIAADISGLAEAVGRGHRQRQRRDTVATIHRRLVEDNRSGGHGRDIQHRVGGGEIIGLRRLANRQRHAVVVNRIHRQGQLANAVASRTGGKRVGIDTGDRQCLVVPLVGVAFTDGGILV